MKENIRFDTPLGFDEPMGWVVSESALIDSLNYLWKMSRDFMV